MPTPSFQTSTRLLPGPTTKEPPPPAPPPPEAGAGSRALVSAEGSIRHQAPLLLYTKAAAAEADYAAALQRTFGAAACEALDDRARNGSRRGHPLHPLYVAKNAASDSWFAETKKANRASARRIIPIGEGRKDQQNCRL
jgi:hypothetical protein